jgi:site-specific recombinase XerD
VPTQPAATHPDFAILLASWELSLSADGYAANTLASYRRALVNFATWLAATAPGIGPAEATREHVRGWIVHVRETTSSGTARSWFAGLRHFCRWAVSENELDGDPTEGIKTPRPNDKRTPVLSSGNLRTLLDTCKGKDFVSRRDAAIIYLFLDCGLRLAELAELTVDDVDLRDRMIYVAGKGSNRSGPRRRAVRAGVKCAQALDRYLRERRRHPFTEQPQLWLGDRGRATLSADGIDAMLKRRGARVGIQIHPHMFRHTWASQFRADGGSEGDLMVLGGWRSRTMLDRYGATVAQERAHEAARRHSLGDRL